MINRFDLTGKTAIITGGTGGLGRAMMEALADAGANICNADINLEAAQKVSDEIAEKYGVKTMAIQTDVSDYEQAQRMADLTAEKFGTIDICVAAAGLGIMYPALEFDPVEWKKVIDVNLNGLFFTNQAVGKYMVKQKTGSIINITSIRAHTSPHPNAGAAYCASKAGVLMMTKCLAKEWALDNVRVNAIAPGFMRTAMAEMNNKLDKVFNDWMAGTPMNRLGKPEELQTAVLYLASDMSGYTTGTELIVDGGFTTY